MASQRLAGRVAVAGEHVEHAGREPDLAGQLAQLHRGERGELAGLEDDGAPGGQRRSQLPGRRGRSGSSRGRWRATTPQRLAEHVGVEVPSTGSTSPVILFGHSEAVGQWWRSPARRHRGWPRGTVLPFSSEATSAELLPPSQSASASLRSELPWALGFIRTRWPDSLSGAAGGLHRADRRRPAPAAGPEEGLAGRGLVTGTVPPLDWRHAPSVDQERRPRGAGALSRVHRSCEVSLRARGWCKHCEVTASLSPTAAVVRTVLPSRRGMGSG